MIRSRRNSPMSRPKNTAASLNFVMPVGATGTLACAMVLQASAKPAQRGNMPAGIVSNHYYPKNSLRWQDAVISTEIFLTSCLHLSRLRGKIWSLGWPDEHAPIVRNYDCTSG